MPVNINVTGNNSVPVNITGGSIPMNMTGGSININKTGGSVVSVNKTGGSVIGRNNNMLSSGTSGFNNYNSSNIVSNQSSNQSLGAGYSTEYVITPQERAKYDQFFDKIDVRGNQYVTGEQSMEFFLKSGLSTQDLAQIWELSDMSNVGRLTREEFYIAMYLIRQKKAGMNLPATLPTCLIPPSLRRGSVNSIHNNTTGNNTQLNQINSSFNNNNQKIGNDLLSSFDVQPSLSTNKYNTTTTSNNSMGFNNLRSPGGSMENEVNKLKNEIQQMDNSILSMTNEKQIMKGQRDQIEQELTNLVSKKNELSMKQTQLKISYDSESKMLNDLRTTYEKENQAREAAQAECNQLEELVKNLKNQKMFVEHDIERCKEEVSQLNNRIKELKTEYSTLKDEVDRLTSEQKHQNDILNVTRQMTMTDQQNVEQLKQDKMNLQKSIQNNQREIEKVGSERTTSGRQDSKNINPFESEDSNDFFSPSTAKSKNKQSFDDAFDALSAHATTFNNENEFKASFDDAFSAPATASVKQSNEFDDAFQVKSAVSAQPTNNNNIFDDAFQVSNNENKTNENVFEDPFEKHAQNIPNTFNDDFNAPVEEKQKAFANSFQPSKNESVLDDPFASNTNLSTPVPATSGFDDAFAIPSNDKKQDQNTNINSFDDTFNNNTNSPFINNGDFDDAFQTNNNSNSKTVSNDVNNQSAPVDFGADFSSAFANNNNNTFNNDPFKSSENNTTGTPVPSNKNQDLAGFSFENKNADDKDKAGFSFDAFDAAAAAATANVISPNDGFQVASPETTEFPIQNNVDEEDSSVGEEDEEIDDDDDDD
eukprot:jgi/Orpsp1_1/1188664/evm.model.d7180000066367.1